MTNARDLLAPIDFQGITLGLRSRRIDPDPGGQSHNGQARQFQKTAARNVHLSYPFLSPSYLLAFFELFLLRPGPFPADSFSDPNLPRPIPSPAQSFFAPLLLRPACSPARSFSDPNLLRPAPSPARSSPNLASSDPLLAAFLSLFLGSFFPVTWSYSSLCTS